MTRLIAIFALALGFCFSASTAYALGCSHGKNEASLTVAESITGGQSRATDKAAETTTKDAETTVAR